MQLIEHPNLEVPYYNRARLERLKFWSIVGAGAAVVVVAVFAVVWSIHRTVAAAEHETLLRMRYEEDLRRAHAVPPAGADGRLGYVRVELPLAGAPDARLISVGAAVEIRDGRLYIAGRELQALRPGDCVRLTPQGGVLLNSRELASREAPVTP